MMPKRIAPRGRIASVAVTARKMRGRSAKASRYHWLKVRATNRTCSASLQASACATETRQDDVNEAGGKEPDEPGVVVERLERRHDEAAPCQDAPERRCGNGAPAPAPIRTVGQIQVFERERTAAHDPVVGDQDPRNRSEPAGVSQ